MSRISTACSAPATRASRRPGAPAASVKTVRSWSASEWRSSSVAPRAKAPCRAAMRPESRPSETLGTARSCATGSEEQLAAADDLLAVHFHGRLDDHAVEVDRDLDVAADRGRGAEGDVRGTEDLLVLEDVAGQRRLFVGADPQLGDVGPVLAVLGQHFEQGGALGASRLGQVAAADGQLDRRLDPADAGDRAVDDEGPLPRPLDRRDEGLAAGQVAEGAGSVEHA